MKRAAMALLPLLCLSWTFADTPDGERVHRPAGSEWVTIATSARVTFYGAKYVPGMVAASGEKYRFERVCALGPGLLGKARQAQPLWWGMEVRITDPATGQQRTYKVIDTGMPELEVDLPDPVWLEWGYPAEQGVFLARVEVRR